MNSVLWVHEEMLNPAVAAALPAVFVFDIERIERERYSLKRIAFIYECLLEMNVEIRKGRVGQQLADFARLHRASRIVTFASPDPWIRSAAAAAGAQLLQPEPFVALRAKPDLKRFSRYWSQAAPLLLDSK